MRLNHGPMLRLLPALALVCSAAAAVRAQALPEALQTKVAACQACHGVDGHARRAAVPHLAGQPRLFIENRLVMMREGLSVVPQMAGLLDGLTDAQLTALSQHYATLPLQTVRATRNAARAARGAALSQRALCGSCHLGDYSGREQIPRLSGQREDYLLQSMRDFAAGRTAGRDTLMSNALLGLTDNDLQDLAHHLATLPAAP